MKIYVASSWRNDYQPVVVRELRDAGHEIYDFKNSEWNGSGFHWSEIDPEYRNWSFSEYEKALTHDLAEAGFNSDMDAMRWADACVLVLPCGRSAHLELGWFVGQGKSTCVLYPLNDEIEPELMTKMCDAQFCRLIDVITWASVEESSE